MRYHRRSSGLFGLLAMVHSPRRMSQCFAGAPGDPKFFPIFLGYQELSKYLLHVSGVGNIVLPILVDNVEDMTLQFWAWVDELV